MRAQPGEYLNCATPQHLADWVRGFAYVDESIIHVWLSTARRFSGPSGADAAMKSLLLHPTETMAFEALSTALLDEIENCNPVMKPTVHSGVSWIETSKVHLATRPGMVLVAPLVINLTHQLRGYLHGLDALFPERGLEERMVLDLFQDWLRVKYDSPLAPWGAIIRVFHGEDWSGISAFVDLWNEFKNKQNTNT